MSIGTAKKPFLVATWLRDNGFTAADIRVATDKLADDGASEIEIRELVWFVYVEAHKALRHSLEWPTGYRLDVPADATDTAKRVASIVSGCCTNNAKAMVLLNEISSKDGCKVGSKTPTIEKKLEALDKLLVGIEKVVHKWCISYVAEFTDKERQAMQFFCGDPTKARAMLANFRAVYERCIELQIQVPYRDDGSI